MGLVLLTNIPQETQMTQRTRGAIKGVIGLLLLDVAIALIVNGATDIREATTGRRSEKTT